jgi:flagellar assembly protein FliH
MSEYSPAIAELWSAPSVQGPAVSVRRDRAQESRQERLAYEQAFAKGEAAGVAAGQARFDSQNAELQNRIQRLDAMLTLLARPIGELDVQMEKQLLSMVLTISRQLVRRELRIDPSQVVAVIRETVALLPLSARDVRVHLHPEDAALVRERLAQPQSDRAWSIVEDPVMSRGGCKVHTDTAQIDARLETRVGQIMSQMLGSERDREQ